MLHEKVIVSDFTPPAFWIGKCLYLPCSSAAEYYLPSQGNAKSSALFCLSRSWDFFICYKRTLKTLVWLRFPTPPLTVHWLTSFQEDKVNCSVNQQVDPSLCVTEELLKIAACRACVINQSSLLQTIVSKW